MLGLNDRHSHLEAMGVHQWYARTSLAGAQSTPDWVKATSVAVASEPQPSIVSDASVDVVRKSSESGSVSNTKSAMDILKQGGLSPSVEKETIRPPKNSQEVLSSLQSEIKHIPELAAERALDNFSLVLYRTSHGLIISESMSGQSHPAEFQLLKNILKSKKALIASHIECNFQHVFNWPVFHSLNLQSKQGNDLRNLLSVWFLSNFDESVREVLYFGSSFSDIERYYSQLLPLVSASLSFVSFKHSLADLIQFPQRKAEIWQEICSLYGE